MSKEAPGGLLQVGSYGEFRDKILADETVEWLFMPALVTVIMHFHHKKNGILTQAEVEDIRDRAVVISSPNGSKERQAKSQGFSDFLYPEHVWVEYLYYIGVLPDAEA